jgi:hypothetical protein
VNRFDPRGLQDLGIRVDDTLPPDDPDPVMLGDRRANSPLQPPPSDESGDCIANAVGNVVCTQSKSNVAHFSVTGYSRTNDKEHQIASVLYTLLDTILAQSNSCSDWLTGSDFNGAQYVSAILNGGDYTFGNGVLNDPLTAAFVGNKNPDGTLISGLPIDSSITVNANGAFFNATQTIGPKAYTGGTFAAQAFILLHEIAHQVGASGFVSDAGNPAAVKANDALVNKNCGSLLQ